MQPIERYGLVALLLLVVTVVAVVLWDRKNQADPGELAALESTAPSDALPAPALSPLGLPLTQPGVAANTPFGAQAEPNSALVSGPSAAPVDPALSAPAPAVEPSAQPLVAANPLITPAPVSESALPVAAKASYRVRAGDTLSSIARRELGQADRWREIAKANPAVDPNRLKVGQALTLPGRANLNSAPAAGNAPVGGTELAARSASRGYTVRAGDSLWTIAATQLGDGGRWREIQALNGNLNGSSLQVGMQLALPAGARPASNAMLASGGAKPANKSASKPKPAPSTKLVASESKVR
jgi:nucleoid-associated protein YgaU